MKEHLVDHVSKDAANDLCDDECRNRNIDRRFIDTCRLDNMETIIMSRCGLEVNVVDPNKSHGKLIIRLDKFLLCLDVEILEPDSIYREKHLLRLVEGDMNQMALLVLMFLDLECSRLGLVEYNWSFHKSILHRKLIVGIDVNDNPIIRQIPRR